MPLHLNFSHRTENLLEGLEAFLTVTWIDLGDAPTIIVPSPSLARWLKLRLCERRGPVVGLETTTLESFLWRALGPGPDEEILLVPALQQALLGVLDSTLLESPSYERVRHFLCPRGEIDPRRKVQFAHEMARLFLEYEYNRPSVWNHAWVVEGLDQTWPDAPYFQRGKENDTETWQRDLHGRLFAHDGPLAGSTGASRRLGLPRLHRIRREEGWTPTGGPLVLFGIDKVSHFHRNLLLEISENREVHAFFLNPCSEFWEDVDTSRKPVRTGRRAGPAKLRFRRENGTDDWQSEELPSHCYPGALKDPFLLERWGRTARENIALWCQANEYDFQSLGEDESPPRTLLGIVQESLRRRHPGPSNTPLEWHDGGIIAGEIAVDSSLTLLESPDRGREMDTVRDQILSWLEGDKCRRPGDIVVYLPDPTRHRADIERVFGGIDPRDPAYLPWTLVGTPSSESRWARGAIAFLRLVEGPLDRPGVFGLLRNELCLKRLGIDTGTLRLWEDWFEGTGMIRSWDAKDRSDEHAPGAAHTLKTGLQRLLIAPLAGPDGARIPGVEVPLSPWRDFDSSDAELLEKFCATLERLQTDCASLRSMAQHASPGELGGELLKRLDAWLDPTDSGEESSVRRALAKNLEALGLRDHAPMSLPELTEIVTSQVEGELPGSSRAWSGAITFAPLRSGNILPHKLILIPGLDADAFPGETSPSSLDLLGARRIVGDPDLVADNRHAFLLALLAAREKLVLSWRARDVQKDEKKDPSSVILELEEALRRGFTKTSLRKRIRLLERAQPLDEEEINDPGWDSWERPMMDFARRAPAVIGTIRNESEVENVCAPPGERVGITGVGQEAAPRMVSAHSTDRIDQFKPHSVSTRRLAMFLLDSWSHRIEQDLEATEEDRPDTLGTTDEPLDSSPLSQTRLRGILFPALMRAFWNGKSLAEIRDLAEKTHARSLWSGEAPEGIQARREGRDLMAWVDEIGRLVSKLRATWPDHRLETGCGLDLRAQGRPSEWALEIPGMGSVRLAARIPVALVGPHEDSPAILISASRAGSKAPRFAFRKRVEPLLWAHLLRRLGHPEVHVILVPLNRGEAEELPAISVPDGSTWLEEVLHDLLSGAHEHLPAGLVVDGGRTTLDALREGIEENTYASEIERLLEPDLPGESREDGQILTRLVERRLGPFLSANPDKEDES